MEEVQRRETGKYVITHYRHDPARLLVVFTSAGGHGVGEPIEEFRKSLLHFGTSLLFVMDRSPSWFSRSDATEALRLAAEIASAYGQVGALGESMGACGAIAFSNVCPAVSRVLAFAPQFSMTEPFISFDDRYANFWKDNSAVNIWEFTAERPEIVTILYGNAEWNDAVHAGMYWSCGHQVRFVDGARHLVAQFLKQREKLLPLLSAFADFGTPFGEVSVNAVLGGLLTHVGLHRDHRFAAVGPWLSDYQSAAYARKPHRLPPPEGLRDLALGRPTDQSSVCEWSRAKTTQADSAGAVAGALTGSYAFHTALEERPWWRVDLGAPARIAEVRIYNRLEHLGAMLRGAQFAIEGSLDEGCLDGTDWVELFRKVDTGVFGGADGKPFAWAPAVRPVARHVRIRLLGTNFLHYDAVEVFGEV